MRYLTATILLMCIACMPKVPKNLNEVVLDRTDGQEWSGREAEQHAGTVFIFFAPQCPLSENYCLQTNTLQEAYRDRDIQFLAVIPGTFFTREEIDDFLQRYQLHVPVLLDPDKDLADLLGATITPEAFVIDYRGQTIYSGAIDNWAVDLGKKREVVTAFYLRDALDALLTGREVPLAQTTAVGCYIE